jgi:hypothetical protein
VYDAALQGRPVVSGYVDSLSTHGNRVESVITERNSGAWPPRNYFSHPSTVPTIGSHVNLSVGYVTVFWATQSPDNWR